MSFGTHLTPFVFPEIRKNYSSKMISQKTKTQKNYDKLVLAPACIIIASGYLMMSQQILKDEYQPGANPQNRPELPIDERQTDKENQKDYGQNFPCGSRQYPSFVCKEHPDLKITVGQLVNFYECVYIDI